MELYLKSPWANKLQRGYCSRSTLARGIVEFVAKPLPERTSRALTNGGHATKDFLRALPASAQGVSRLPISAQLYELSKPAPSRRWGRPLRKGKPLGSPKTFARKRKGLLHHPSEAGAKSNPGWGCGIRSCQVGPSAW